MKLIFIITALLIQYELISQIAPSKEENIDFIVTFGKDAAPTWGDDDHSQVYFISIPVDSKEIFYVRVFDPEVGGKNDQINGVFNTTTIYSIYGGKGCYSNNDSRNINPVGSYKSGTLISTTKFALDDKLDNNWYSLGPFNPNEGELDKELNARVFKIIIESTTGDDGNAYKLSLSNSNKENIEVYGANFFAYEICFRMINKNNETCHLYPFINGDIVKVKQHNFDADNDGYMRVNSVAKKSNNLDISGDGVWKTSDIQIVASEINTSLDIHIIKGKKTSNDLTIYLTNQYNKAVPFFSSPIGGKPNYKYKITVDVEVK